jgi:hypothetical protein
MMPELPNRLSKEFNDAEVPFDDRAGDYELMRFTPGGTMSNGKFALDSEPATVGDGLVIIRWLLKHDEGCKRYKLVKK